MAPPPRTPIITIGNGTPTHPALEQKAILLELTVAGSIDDVTPHKAHLRTAFASIAGVSEARAIVALKPLQENPPATPGGQGRQRRRTQQQSAVLVVASILTDGLSEDAANTTLANLQASLQSEDAATAALSNQNGLTSLTVLQVISPPEITWVIAPSLNATPSAGDAPHPVPYIILGVVGGGVALAFASICCRKMLKAEERARLVEVTTSNNGIDLKDMHTPAAHSSALTPGGGSKQAAAFI